MLFLLEFNHSYCVFHFDSEMPTKLFVGNLPDSCTEEAIHDLFTSYGYITELSIIKNFAFVHFKHEGDAQNAVRDLNGVKLLGKVINVDISKSQGVKDKWGDRRNNQPRDFHLDNNNHNFQSFSEIPPVDHMAPPVGSNLGILHAVHTLAAVAEKQRSNAQRNTDPFSDHRVERNSEFIKMDQQVSTSNVNKVVSNNSRYVVYERYYVDPKHPLLKGLPIPELPGLPNSQVSYPQKYPVPANKLYPCDTNHSESYFQRDINTYRARSPVTPHIGMVDRNYSNSYRR